jgi:hypothetical protein
MSFRNLIVKHYEDNWNNHSVPKVWSKGPVEELPPDFCVLEFPPSKTRTMWTYATCCMSQPDDDQPLELHLFSPITDDLHVELLTVVAHFHVTGERLGLGHTVNFGRPWIVGSRCDHGLISLPYLDGPTLETFQCPDFANPIEFLWLLPITKKERDFKKANGLEALERRFEAAQFNYVDPTRKSVV